jgi:hypothetical protein
MTDVPETALRARQMYADGVDTRTILASTGLSTWAFYRWLDGMPSAKAPNLLPPLPRRRVTKSRRVTAGDRRALIARMMRAAEQQVSEIERRIGATDTQQERDTRMLAVLVRTMRDLTAADELNQALEQTAEYPQANDGHTEHPLPRDVDELRRSVARKLAQIIAERGTNPDDAA